MIANGAAALKTGMQYIGWGANKILEKAEEHKLAERTQAALIAAQKKAKERGLTDEIGRATKQAAADLKEGASNVYQM